MMEPFFHENIPWSGHLGIQQARPRRYYYARDLADLQAIVEEARTCGATVRAVGSGHSYSDIALADDFMVDTSELVDVLPLPPSLPGLDRDIYVNVESGIKLEQLLVHLAARHRALENLGGYTGQSVAGVISTSTHGTGVELRSLSDAIVSMVLVTETGTVRIERGGARGFTDPDAYLAVGDGSRLLQSDRHFYAALVSMGAFGLIHSVVLRTRSRHRLRQQRTHTTWRAVRPLLEDRSLFRDPEHPHRYSRHVALWVNPHETNGERTVIVTRAEIDDGAPNGPPPASSFLDAVMRTVPGQRLMQAWINAHPASVPGLIDLVMQGQVTTEPNVHYQERILSSSTTVDGYAIEAGFSMKKDAFIAGVEAAFQVAAEERERHGRYMSLLSLRFVRPMRAYLSPQYADDDYPVCMIEVPTPGGIRRSATTLKRLLRRWISLGGRPHWGLDLDIVDARTIRRLYPRFDDWHDVYRELNPRGMFAGRFGRRVGL